MDISKYEINISKHALYRAIQKNIDADNIKSILKKAEVQRFGKHGIKFINKGSKRTVICVGQIIGTKIKIFTVEEK